MDEIVPELKELKNFLQNKKKYEKIGAEIPSGILFYGPPGCGKTYAVRALATESGYNLIVATGSEFQDKYVGEGSKKIKNLFKKARKKKPCIIFIDEVDSVAGKRDSIHNFRDDTLNQLLTEMDGFEKNEDIIVIGATNLKDSIDPAFMRPGRIDKTIYFSLPDKKGREELLEFYCNKMSKKGPLDL